MNRLLVWIPALGLLLGGCTPQQAAPDAETPTTAEDFGSLPGLQKTRSKRLRDELARVIEQGATPELLSRARVPADRNAAVVLLDLFPKGRLEAIREEAEAILPPKEKAEYDMPRLARAIDFRKRHDSQRQQAREATGRPQCDFGIQFKAGYLAELRFIDVVKVCADLEAFQAAEALAEGRNEEAVEALEFMLRVIQLLAAEKQLDARLEAAYLRTTAYCVLTQIVEDRRTTREQLARLYRFIEDQLKRWPDDAQTWIGERAMGMHAYELARTGNLQAWLGDEQFDELDREGYLRQLAGDDPSQVDRDELFYLETMQRIIQSCRQPYHERVAMLEEIEAGLQARASQREFPRLAACVLLADVRQGQIVQAQDRANWEAWAVALAAALGLPKPAQRVNPLTGQAYSQTAAGGFVEVGNIGTGQQGDDPQIRVPVLSHGN